MQDTEKNNLHMLQQDIQEDCLKDMETIVQLECLLACEERLDAYLEALYTEGLEPVPTYLGEEVLAYINNEVKKEQRTDFLKQRRNIKAVWLPLLGYSAKISFAVACAILMLFHLPDATAEMPKRSNEKGRVHTSYVADTLEFITNKVFMEE